MVLAKILKKSKNWKNRKNRKKSKKVKKSKKSKKIEKIEKFKKSAKTGKNRKYRKYRKNSKKVKNWKNWKIEKEFFFKKIKIIKKNYRSVFPFFCCCPIYDTGTHDSLPRIYPMPVLENVRDRVFMVSATCCLLLVTF